MSVYADTSALVKLATREPETDALGHLLTGQVVLTSRIGVLELRRTMLRLGLDETAGRTLIRRLSLIPLTEAVLRSAESLPTAVLRSLDAIHLASALAAQGATRQFVTYDLRLAESAGIAGLEVVAPSAAT